MTQIVLDVSPSLARELAARHIDESRASEIALAALRVCIEHGTHGIPSSDPEDAATFARELIDQNRPLFEELAQL